MKRLILILISILAIAGGVSACVAETETSGDAPTLSEIDSQICTSACGGGEVEDWQSCVDANCGGGGFWAGSWAEGSGSAPRTCSAYWVHIGGRCLDSTGGAVDEWEYRWYCSNGTSFYTAHLQFLNDCTVCGGSKVCHINPPY